MCSATKLVQMLFAAPFHHFSTKRSSVWFCKRMDQLNNHVTHVQPLLNDRYHHLKQSNIHNTQYDHLQYAIWHMFDSVFETLIGFFKSFRYVLEMVIRHIVYFLFRQEVTAGG